MVGVVIVQLFFDGCSMKNSYRTTVDQ